MQIIDLHCDTISHLTDKPKLSLADNYLGVDMAKLAKANSLAQFFALFVDAQEHPNRLQRGLDMVDVLYREIEANQHTIAMAKNYTELCTNRAQGKISAFLTIEEGGVLEGSMENLRNFYRLGVRLITLTWNYPNELGYPNITENYRNLGLTAFGRQVVAEMNRLGMLIDVSHLSDGGFYDVAKTSVKPFVASHSNARAICNHPRNLTDEMIRLLAEKGGIMGLNFAGSFLGHPKVSRIEDMVQHLQHIIKVGGDDVIALGTDFDGIEYEMEIENMGQIDKLIRALEQHSFTYEQIEKFCYKNTLRVIQDCL